MSSEAQVLVFIRFQHDGNFIEKFLFCRPLATSATGKDIFDLVNDFFSQHGLKWKNCVAVSTDGAPAMMGHKKGFCAYVKEQNPSVMLVHCLLHRENLAAKELSPELPSVFHEVVQIVDFIKSRPKNVRIFRHLALEAEADFVNLLLHFFF